jgi:hypothetical protein
MATVVCVPFKEDDQVLATCGEQPFLRGIHWLFDMMVEYDLYGLLYMYIYFSLPNMADYAYYAQ